MICWAIIILDELDDGGSFWHVNADFARYDTWVQFVRNEENDYYSCNKNDFFRLTKCMAILSIYIRLIIFS